MSVAWQEWLGTLGGVGPEGRQKEDPIGSSLARGCGVICPAEVKGMGRGDAYKQTFKEQTDCGFLASVLPISGLIQLVSFQKKLGE